MSHLLLFVLLLPFVRASNFWSTHSFDIASISPQTPIIAQESSVASLTCETTGHNSGENALINDASSWKECQWTRASDGSSCEFVWDGEDYIQKTCSPRLAGRVEFFGDANNTLCGLNIKELTVGDSGEWRCRVKSCSSFYPHGNSDCKNAGAFAKHSEGVARLMVFRPPKSMTLVGLEEPIRVKNTVTSLSCAIEDFYPRVPGQEIFRWTHRNKWNEVQEIDGERGPVYSSCDESNRCYASQEFQFKSSWPFYENQELRCEVSLVNTTANGEGDGAVLYRQQRSRIVKYDDE